VQTPSGPATGGSSTASSSLTSSPPHSATPEVSSAYFVFSSGLHGPNSQPRPANSTLPFISVIVEAPVLQIIAMVIGFFMLMLELPAPFLKGTAIHRSLILRVVGLLFQTFVCILYYQVRRLPCASQATKLTPAQGTNAAIYSFIAFMGYARAMSLGEKMVEAKDNRGKGGRA
jgi:hypothetical protein